MKNYKIVVLCIKCYDHILHLLCKYLLRGWVTLGERAIGQILTLNDHPPWKYEPSLDLGECSARPGLLAFYYTKPTLLYSMLMSWDRAIIEVIQEWVSWIDTIKWINLHVRKFEKTDVTWIDFVESIGLILWNQSTSHLTNHVNSARYPRVLNRKPVEFMWIPQVSPGGLAENDKGNVTGCLDSTYDRAISLLAIPTGVFQ